MNIAGKSNGYTRRRRETRNNATSQFGHGTGTCGGGASVAAYQSLISDLVLESEYLG